jgi:hypothetical protein
MSTQTKTRTIAVGDLSQSLQTFDLNDLQQYTSEKSYDSTASKDFHLFYVGRDDVHDILKHILSRVRISLYINTFGFDDEELNDIVMKKAKDPIVMMITLDRTQAGSVHEKRLMDSDIAENPAAYNTYFAISESATYQISHSKGFVADVKVGGEASTNWSLSGEGTFIVTGQPGGGVYKAQNQTHSIFTDPDAIRRFQSELIAEHMAARVQMVGNVVEGARLRKGGQKRANK